ncbi:hypothetical protein ACCS99_20005 [Rhizobium ruizarguesonis]
MVASITEWFGFGQAGQAHGHDHGSHAHLFEREGAVLVGATNHANLIDPAVLRSGHLEEHVYLSLPDEAERADILSYHLDRALSADELRSLTEDLVLATAADLERLSRRAKRLARGRNDALRLADVRAAIPVRITLPEEVIHRIAVHEAGHALAALATGFVDSVSIQIESFMSEGIRVQDGGRVKYGMRDPILPNEKQLLANIGIQLAGMAAEEVVFATRSTGSGGHPGSDLDQASRLAYRFAGSYGLGSRSATISMQILLLNPSSWLRT